jgi:hypothetical protein
VRRLFAFWLVLGCGDHATRTPAPAEPVGPPEDPPIVAELFDSQAARWLTQELTTDNMADAAQACAAFVNGFHLRHDPRFRDRAKQIADHLVANAFLAGEPEPGWGPRRDEGYGFCPDLDDFKGKNLWDTTRALDCLLKVAELDPADTTYVALARRAVDAWPSERRELPGEKPMRFYSKNAQACARRYVKNTNIAMGEVLYRLAKATGERSYRERADEVLDAELWEILTKKNFGYHGAMIYVEPDDAQNRVTLDKERRSVERDADGNTVCRSKRPAPPCWNHLGFEGYALYQAQLLSGRDTRAAIDRVMTVYRTSPLGDTQRFPWDGKESPTHVTAYNCYLRGAGAIYRDECMRALSHKRSSAMIFYSLVPDTK